MRQYGYVQIALPTEKHRTFVRAHRLLFHHLGWDALDDGTGSYWMPNPPTGPYTRTVYVRPLSAMGGHHMRISFHPSKHSTQPGKAFRFRVTKSARTRDLIRLAHATKGDWHWMTDTTGKRVSRDEWLSWAALALPGALQGPPGPSEGYGSSLRPLLAA